jgi:hypothetical protein
VFLQGFLFALGFGAGCLVLFFTLATAILVSERFFLHFHQSKEMDGTVDIRRWQQRKLAGKRGHDHPRSAG